MKKLFASLLAATMVAGMAVSAFAYVGKDGNAIGTDNEAVVELADTKVDYSLTAKPLDKDGEAPADFVGGKLYFPILVSKDVTDEDGKIGVNGYAYANKASEVEDLRAKVKATIGGQYVEKEANIVRKDKMISTDSTVKVYCVEVKVADFADVNEKEVEFDVALYNKNRKEAEVENYNLTFGKDATALANGDEADEFSKPVKFRNNELTLYIKEGAKAYKLDTVGDDADNEVERIYLELADAEASYEVAASDQGDLYLGYSTSADKALVIANEEAEMSFLEFDANPEFDFTGTLRLTVEDPDKTYFCYEIEDGKLTPAGKYNAEDECFEIRTRTLGSYVLADKELVSAVADEEEAATEKPADETATDNTTTGNKVVGTGAIA